MGLPMDKSYLLTQLRNFKSIILDPAYIIQKTTLPTATADLEGVVYQYIGNSSSLTLGGFYQCQSDGAVSPTYSWVEIPVKINTDGTTVLKNSNGELYVPTATASALGLVKAGDGTAMNNGALDVVDRIKMVSLMPTASASLVGTAVMFLGTAGTYTRGSIYECVSDGESTPTYSWEILLNADSAAEIEALTNQVNDMNNVLGAKNVLPFPYYAGSGTYNGVTITDNGDGSITLDGTCTGMSFFVFYGGRYSLAPTTFVKKNEDYIATLEVVSGSMAINSGTSRFVFRNYITNATSPFVDIFYEDNVIDTRSVKFTYEPTAFYDTSLVWYEFNVGTTFNNWCIRPMIRLASISDDTYVPYAKTNQQLTKDTTALLDNLEVNGAVNMLSNDATTTTIRGITFTVNDDGTVTATGTQDGTSGGAYLHVTDTFTCESGTYKLTGCPSGGSQTKYRVYVYDHTSGSTGEVTNASDVGDGAIFNLQSGHEYNINIMIGVSKTVTNLVFKPMITVASYNGDYVPYAMTNRELTENVEELSTNATKLVGLSTPVSIFDVLTDRSLYPSSNAYWATAAKLTNGNNTFSSLLSINDNAIVRIDVYSEWYIGIEINDASHGNALIAWANKTTTQLKFIQINTSTSPYVSQVTINKAP